MAAAADSATMTAEARLEQELDSYEARCGEGVCIWGRGGREEGERFFGPFGGKTGLIGQDRSLADGASGLELAHLAHSRPVRRFEAACAEKKDVAVFLAGEVARWLGAKEGELWQMGLSTLLPILMDRVG